MKTENVVSVENKQDRSDPIERSENARKNFTIISQELYQKSGLSLEAIGLISYLMSLPDNWTVYVSQLRKFFKIGKNKTLSILKELIQAGYVQRYPVRCPKGRIAGWKTKYSDTPEFLRHNPELHFPALDNPELDYPPLQNNNNTKKNYYKNNNKQNKKTNLTNKQGNVVVVSLMKTLEDLAISQTLIETWVKEYGVDYVNEKIALMRASNPKNPEGYLNHAITHDWQPAAPKPKAATTEPVEPQYPTHDENVAWYQSLSTDEKLTHYQTAARHHVAFEHMLTQQKLSVLDTTFTQNTFFKMMMSLIGRAP